MISKALLAGKPVRRHCKGNGLIWAVVVDGRVINTVHWDPAEAPDWKPLRGVAVPLEQAQQTVLPVPVTISVEGSGDIPGVSGFGGGMEIPEAPIPIPQPSMQDILQSVTDSLRQEDRRYELALMALNKNMEAMEAMQPQAQAAGLTVEQLARQIVDERENARRLSGEID